MTHRFVAVFATMGIVLAGPSASTPVARADDATTVAPAAPRAGAAEHEPRTEGLIPGVLVGPKVTATLLFPANVMVGLELKVLGYVGASFEYGVFPRSPSGSTYAVSVDTWSAGLRAYPWRGTFFVGAVLGKYDVTATEQGVPGYFNVNSVYLGPQIGWKWAYDFGLFLGLNLGYGFSLSYGSTLTQPAGTGELHTAKENVDQYLKVGAPIFTLLEIGWLF